MPSQSDLVGSAMFFDVLSIYSVMKAGGEDRRFTIWNYMSASASDMIHGIRLVSKNDLHFSTTFRFWRMIRPMATRNGIVCGELAGEWWDIYWFFFSQLLSTSPRRYTSDSDFVLLFNDLKWESMWYYQSTADQKWLRSFDFHKFRPERTHHRNEVNFSILLSLVLFFVLFGCVACTCTDTHMRRAPLHDRMSYGSSR